ncbi:MAG: 30S ribosomal protein S8 [Candidatus Yonathbacteria bacterium CG10_big_fil_rev_8_21_14_0_10_43_136]|uniref:Small ribosomal subunit protein uS8 n=2 Tax=Parcubacteria group TaxID=1794811 RepID=A0A2M7Q4W9_9BACT|nr:MAG: 30S ribosomal protein S8 [Candidatus Nomurabacteria bacterium CG2_30_43_9]PIQ36101.1 MAG: 30S ribosomal protein S8 [Candidatus Yonathbacteria bacterium CG17_big_fil_post_rev_8_21_14_2_50_43_9]PIR40451.1 MAG: 30S ribosomal protein S8 [Candidatus Yonathbacteria bacterium CG10_big_fil_rev_8_21_14_0_10_43_136]PIX56916.1 MAG: 30S ribosomal protein S8 [Candidatus Yonathbacteria bacterium CG_4_10_14_3_um_filter_43_12]PIY58132.1 MAG: 30S ribosomal protein S8 [Candidatus Yonathbacteria bacterium
MHDPISDMLIRIKNGGTAGKEIVEMPFSNVKEAIAKVLFTEGYITSYAKKGKKVQKTLEVGIAYEGKTPRVSDLARMSKPSRRFYLGADEIKPIKNGFGLMVMSTPKGIMTGADAKKGRVGGEALFKIW